MNKNLKTRSGVLMVDDEENFLFTASITLKSAGFDPVWTINDSRELMSFLEQNHPGVIILDLTMPHLTGRDLLPLIVKEHPDIQVVILTANDDLEMAVQCMRKGACDYLVKPVEETRLIGSVRSQLEVVTLRQEMQHLKNSFLTGAPSDGTNAFDPIVTASKRMNSLFSYVRAVSPSEHPVLISGETGVGKELFARAVHDLSGKTGKYVAVNVAGLDDNHFSDTLFGHEKGAYTGAERPRDGLVSKAAQGTLFLDEIGDLAESSQVKLLRLLQEREYYSLGSDVPRPSRARVIVSTNHDLYDGVRKGIFRKDLFYRLRTHEVCIPPLRERIEDLPLLLDHFLLIAAQSLNKKEPSYPGELLTVLRNYHFPGNVRELEAMVNDAVARHESGVLSMESFKKAIIIERELSSLDHQVSSEADDTDEKARFSFTGAFPTIREVESYLIDEAMKRAQENQTIAADLLGITRQTLNKRLTRARKKD